MKIVTFVQDGRRKPGAVVNGNIVDLSPAATTVQELIEGGPGMLARAEAAAKVGKLVAERAKAAGVEAVAFDRSGYRFHGRVKALADAAREAGLQF